jgi:uncharacterized protein YqgV (UPF0045/DUF77 family)
MGKNSFILYNDQKNVIDKLTDEQAGKLIKAIYAYVNDEEMILDNMLDLVITPFITALEKDKEKYIETCNKRARAGSEGGKQRVANQANASKSKQIKQKVANQADKDNDKDNDNEIYKKENIKEKAEKIHFAEFVTMSNVEYETLVNTHGKEFADQCITRLDNYKGSSGKTYKSDYRAILSWVIDEVKKNQGKATKSNAYVNEKQSEYNDLDRFYN